LLFYQNEIRFSILRFGKIRRPAGQAFGPFSVARGPLSMTIFTWIKRKSLSIYAASPLFVDLKSHRTIEISASERRVIQHRFFPGWVPMKC
jgi:hypothetical protein